MGCFGELASHLTNQMWISVACGRLVSPQQILTTVMTHVVVDKSTNNGKLHSICFYHNINVKEYDQERDTLTRAALSVHLSTTAN